MDVDIEARPCTIRLTTRRCDDLKMWIEAHFFDFNSKAFFDKNLRIMVNVKVLRGDFSETTDNGVSVCYCS